MEHNDKLESFQNDEELLLVEIAAYKITYIIVWYSRRFRLARVSRDHNYVVITI